MPAGPTIVIEKYVTMVCIMSLWDCLIIQFFSDINCNTSDLLNGQVIKQFWVKLKRTEAIL